MNMWEGKKASFWSNTEREEEEEQEEQLTMNKENRKLITEIKESFNVYRKAKKEYEEAKERFNNTSKLEDDVRKQVRKSYDEKTDTQAYKKMCEAIEELNNSRGHKFKTEMLRLFNLPFEECRSKNHGVCKCPGRHWEVTLGKKGFARRDNVQAQDLGFYDMVAILKNAETIAKEIKKTNLDEQADKLLAFANAFPFDTYEDHVKNKIPRYTVDADVFVNAISNNGIAKEIQFEKKRYRDGLNINVHCETPDGENTFMHSISSMNRMQPSSADSLVWIQIEPIFELVCESITQQCKEEIKQFKEDFKDLQDEFRTYVLADKL